MLARSSRLYNNGHLGSVQHRVKIEDEVLGSVLKLYGKLIHEFFTIIHNPLAVIDPLIPFIKKPYL